MFRAYANNLEEAEKDTALQLHTAISGNSNLENLYLITIRDAETLRSEGIFTISQLFKEDNLGRVLNQYNLDINTLYGISGNRWLQTKLERLADKMQHNPQLLSGTASKSIHTSLELELKNGKMSQIYRAKERKRRDTEILEPPAYRTRIRDNIPVPSLEDFQQAYKVVKHKYLLSKTKENAFQTLNRTIWTRNKAMKSNTRDDANCPFCGHTETMEHLLADCTSYSTPRWEHLTTILQTSLRDILKDPTVSTPITYKNIFYH